MDPFAVVALLVSRRLMFKRHFSHRLKIGRLLGIDLFIHWTFWLLFFGVGGAGLYRGESWIEAGMHMLQIGLLFLCVTLHEYGHAMMARQFGIRTIDITLLPIGGLARLERMPRIPWQEFLVAVAGPAVNVVIAIVVAIGLFASIPGLRTDFGNVFPSVMEESVIGWLLGMNVMLVLFNMIPAFPMDGGRVLRSLLAMMLEYRSATRIAARLGLFAAFGMAYIGLSYPDFRMLLFVAAFIGYAGWMESRQVDLSESIRGIRVEEGLVAPTCHVGAMDSLAQLVEIFSKRTDRALPVLGVETFYLGMIEIEAVASAVSRGAWNAVASDLMQRDWPTLRAPGMLERQLTSAPPVSAQMLPVVDKQGHLLGLFDFERMGERAVLHRHLSARQRQENDPIEAVLVSTLPPGSLSDTYL